MTHALFVDLITILSAGFLSGAICRRLGIPLIVGYLIVGAVIGDGALGLVGEAHNAGIEDLAEAGVLLLLFSIGLEFSLEDLARLSRHLLIGGSLQMALVALPVFGIFLATGMNWRAAALLGAAVSLSSTVLVFKSLAEYGQTSTPHGRRAIGILLFQDVALVPLLLVVPMLTGEGSGGGVFDLLRLAVTTGGLVAGVIVLRMLLKFWLVPLLARERSPELVVLFTLVVLGGVTLGVDQAGLPAAIGAFAAGLVFSGNRFTGQVDAVVLPLRELFAAVFFVSLGMLLNPREVVPLAGPILLGLVGVLVLKSLAATVALRATGLNWRTSIGTGVGLAQMGEFSFVLVLVGAEHGLISPQSYQITLSLALGSLVLSPLMLKRGLEWAARASDGETEDRPTGGMLLGAANHPAVVIGAGPVGRQIASRLEIAGIDACLIDISPVNLHPFAQQGFMTVAGDATDPEILKRAGVIGARIAVLCLPDDQVSIRVARSVRSLNAKCHLLARCRYFSNRSALIQAGAEAVVVEEIEASDALLRILGEL